MMIMIYQIYYFSIWSMAAITSPKEGSANSLTYSLVCTSTKNKIMSRFLVITKVLHLSLPVSKQTCFPIPQTTTPYPQTVLGNHQVSSQSEKALT